MSTWAIIKTGGKQYKVGEGDKLLVDLVKPDKAGNIVFSQVLAVNKENDLTIGQPFVEKVKVQAKVLNEDFKAKKMRVVKFKPKSRYLRVRGHRQRMTQVLIEKIQ